MTAKSDWIGNGEPNYEQLVRSWGYEVVSFDTTSEWQGDYVVLLAEGNRRGFAVIGYGSCSGCDALQAIGENWSELQEFSNQLRSQVHWEDTPTALAAWLNARKDQGLDWHFSDDEILGVVSRYRKLLTDTTEDR